MSLVKCTECGKEISDKAVSCPNCGCPVSQMKTETASNYGYGNSYYGDSQSKIYNGGNIVVQGNIDLSSVIAYINSGNKIQAIKELRELTNMGLKEAKDAVEEIERSKNMNLEISFISHPDQTQEIVIKKNGVATGYDVSQQSGNSTNFTEDNKPKKSIALGLVMFIIGVGIGLAVVMLFL